MGKYIQVCQTVRNFFINPIIARIENAGRKDVKKKMKVNNFLFLEKEKQDMVFIHLTFTVKLLFDNFKKYGGAFFGF